ncbi:MAG TPA: CPBP family intramembrane metalloprotease [Hyphomicrobiaceae bacterium]|nr:CPBP family intramembrane metalloprotease [Hyphomicrobiaceae bacterium]
MNGAQIGNQDEIVGRFGDTPYRVRTRWSWWQASAVVVSILVVAALVAQAALLALPAAGFEAAHWQLLTALAVSQVICSALVWWVAGWLGDQRVEVLALGPPVQGWRSYVLASMAMALIFGTLSWLMWTLEPDLVIRDLTVYVGLIRSPAWWLAVLVIVVGAPVMEELMFRGFLFATLARSRLGIGGAAIVTSLGWAALHAGYSLAGLVEVFLVGLYFSLLLVKTGSLRVPMFCHGAYNLSALVMLLAVDIPVAASG